MAFREECITILRGLREGIELLDTLENESMIDAVYGDEIKEALRKMNSAEQEAQYIEDQEDTSDVDVESALADIKRTQEHLEELHEKLESAESDLSDAKDYLGGI